MSLGGVATSAAFFDLDKTVLARSSMMAFAPSFRRAGMLRRSALLRAAWSHLCYVRWGAGPRRLERVQRAVLRTTAGWDQAQVRDLVAGGLEVAIDPIVHREAADAIAAHRAAGRPVVLVSAAPEELVEPIGARLGVDAVIASRAVLDAAGCYSGRLERYAYGPAKALLIQEWAAERGIELASSWAYSDSATDVPMLEAVGNAVAVNPDRVLRRVASLRGWSIERFGLAPPAEPPAPSKVGRASAAVAVMAAATGGFTVWARRRPSRAG